mmetsp:Transcript_93349/g.165996  ORF Transcript_93349/g.165996 Transcript_93349/m.165996 type:complete len:444 (-) Transcript_93349:14-1345(-)
MASEAEPPQQRPFMVVLTGGPSSGKSSALALLRDRLTARGFQVLTVPENATHFLANSDGFQPEWAGTDSQVRMQRIFLDFQISQEEAFKAFAALHPSKKAVILLDCCTINSKVYVSDEQWAKVLKLPGHVPYTEEVLFGRYDLVVHMVTCALEGHYEWGPGSNNPGRYHTPEQAKEQDIRCLEVFRNHPQLRVVPHCAEFKDKIEKVAEFVNDALQIEGLTGSRRRRTCRIEDSKAFQDLLNMDSMSASLVSITFLDDAVRHSVRRRAKISNKVWGGILQRWQTYWTEAGACSPSDAAAMESECLQEATNFLYERRDVVAGPNPRQSGYLTRRVIQEQDYYLAVESKTGNETSSASKLVLRFLDGSQYFELFFFLGRKDLILDLSTEVLEVPAYLKLTGGRDLKREDSSSATLLKAADEPTEVKKRPRTLRAHSTEEAALFGC